MTTDDFNKLRIGSTIRIKPDLHDGKWYGTHMYYDQMYKNGYVKVNYIGRDSVNINGVRGFGYTKEMLIPGFKYGK
jgi:hypothetical protein